MLARAPFKVKLVIWYTFMVLSVPAFLLLLFSAWENATHQPLGLRIAYLGFYVAGWLIWLRSKPRGAHELS